MRKRGIFRMQDALLADVDLVGRIDAIPTILDIVCRTTGMGFAAVARVTEAHWVACQVLDKIQFGLQPGGELEIGTTICNEIRQSGEPVVIDDVAKAQRSAATLRPRSTASRAIFRSRSGAATAASSAPFARSTPSRRNSTIRRQ